MCHRQYVLKSAGLAGPVTPPVFPEGECSYCKWLPPSQLYYIPKVPNYSSICCINLEQSDEDKADKHPKLPLVWFGGFFLLGLVVCLVFFNCLGNLD